MRSLSIVEGGDREDLFTRISLLADHTCDFPFSEIRSLPTGSPLRFLGKVRAEKLGRFIKRRGSRPLFDSLHLQAADKYNTINPLTPKSDQYQISPGDSAGILHHTVGRTWLFIAYSDEKRLYYQILIASFVDFSIKGWENVLFELGSERVKSSPSLQSRRISGHALESRPPSWFESRESLG